MNQQEEFARLTQTVCEQLARIEQALTEYSERFGEGDLRISQQLMAVTQRMRAIEVQAERVRRAAGGSPSTALDPVTGLPDRAAFDERMSIELKRFKRYHRPFSVARLDIDALPALRVRHGVPVAEKIAAAIAKLATSKLRAVDFIACHGEGAFLIVFPETREAQAKLVLEKLRLVAAKIPFKVGGQPLLLSLSAGISECVISDQATSVLERVDAALQRARQEGSNRCVVHSPHKAEVAPKKAPRPLGISQEFPVISTSFSKL